MAEEEVKSWEYTPTWVIAAVCSVIVLISYLAERALHYLGKCFKHKKQKALQEGLQKLKQELMLLGFISLLLTVAQGPISFMCISNHLASIMLPCKAIEEPISHQTMTNIGRRLLLSQPNEVQYCKRKGKVPMFSREAIHQLHIFIFILALVHVIFCATTMVLGSLRIRQWKLWEDSEMRKINLGPRAPEHGDSFVTDRTHGYWRKFRLFGWMRSFFKQFYTAVTKSDYTALLHGFLKEHKLDSSWPKEFNFHSYMLLSLEYDFKQMVGISWYLWLFVVIFLLLNLAGWHTYFWLAFLPLILLLLVGAHLEHVITRLARDVAERKTGEDQPPGPVKPSNKHFFLHNPKIILHLIHFILFQNSFEMAFFVWVWTSYGLESCIMENLALIIPRLVVGFIVQVVCSYSTFPLFALVTQMGSDLNKKIVDEIKKSSSSPETSQINQMDRELSGGV